ncbi:MAG: hypothetical protein HeimC3_24060 [Candidatus Heimdallarchaeota archaeon LC_3]|nr:MAG: hypothetical protein HeimC3_24060 [Candidatus Heimdallarchaeota archaeon LC_3]
MSILTLFLFLSLRFLPVAGSDLEIKASVGDMESFEFLKFQSKKNMTLFQTEEGKTEEVTIQKGFKYSIKISSINESTTSQDVFCQFMTDSFISAEEHCDYFSYPNLDVFFPDDHIIPTVDNKSFWEKKSRFYLGDQYTYTVTDETFEINQSYTINIPNATQEIHTVNRFNWKDGWIEYYYLKNNLTSKDPDISSLFHEVEIIKLEISNVGITFYGIFYPFSVIIFIGLIRYQKRK